MSGERVCTVCSRPGEFTFIYQRAGFTLVRCPGCGLMFQDPQPSAETLDGAYYFDADFARRLEEGDLRSIAAARAREKIDLLDRAGVAQGGTALDVGCSSGAWMEVAREAGWDPVGIEIGEPAARLARRRGFEVLTGTLESVQPKVGGRSFSLITFWDVLEHLRDPLDSLRRASALLAPGGVIAMTFPNVGGWYPRLTYRLIARRTGVWEYPELPVHLYDFSPSTAKALLARAGLEAATITTTAVPFDFYRTTTLTPQLAERGRRGRTLMAAFAVLRSIVYPVAQVFDRGNAMFVVAREPATPR